MLNRNVIFVIGPANSGKTYFIKRHFLNADIIDLYEFQKNRKLYTPEQIMQTYEECRDALIEALKNTDIARDVVLEHTLVLAKRRPMYIDAVRSVCGTDQKIECWYALPTLEQYERYDLADLEATRKEDPNGHYSPMSLREMQTALDMFEIPTESEGFSSIHKIHG